jgi:uncharacterized protein DUF3710
VAPAGTGPHDSADAPKLGPHMDLGSLRVPAVDGVEVRVQADPDGTVQQVVLVYGDNAMQLGVFAAPRSEGIWDEVRKEIRDALTADGVSSRETRGVYGTELRARVTNPDGPADVRFVGIDGPRWMVRAVFQGPAAVDPAAAGPLLDCLTGLVVDRGKEAFPVREALPLRLPRDLQESVQASTQAGQQSGTVPAPGMVNGVKRRPSPRAR